jgi:hypothetical protein
MLKFAQIKASDIMKLLNQHDGFPKLNLFVFYCKAKIKVLICNILIYQYKYNHVLPALWKMIY